MQIDTKTMSADAIITHLTTAGVASRDAALIASAWIYENVAQIRRTFLYGAEFAATDPALASSFAQTFHHRDWVDGEDVVQAGTSATDEGFNSRLHKIEADLGALGAEVAKIYDLMGGLRAELAARLEEIRVELNRVEAEASWYRTVPAGGPPRYYEGMVNNSSFVGVSQIDKQAVQIWKTEQGMMMLPQVTPIPSDPVNDKNVANAAALANFASAANVQTAFAGKSFGKADLIAKFGDQTLSTGAKVSDVVASLPSTAQFAKVDDLVTAVAEQSAQTLKQQIGVPEALAQSLNLHTTAAATGDASVDALTSLPEPQRTALKSAGISTVRQLAGADPAAISTAFTKAGVSNATAGEIAAVRQTAHVITLLR